MERSPEHFSGRLLVADVDPQTRAADGAPREGWYAAKDDRGGGWSIAGRSGRRTGRSSRWCCRTRDGITSISCR